MSYCSSFHLDRPAIAIGIVSANIRHDLQMSDLRTNLRAPEYQPSTDQRLGELRGEALKQPNTAR